MTLLGTCRSRAMVQATPRGAANTATKISGMITAKTYATRCGRCTAGRDAATGWAGVAGNACDSCGGGHLGSMPDMRPGLEGAVQEPVCLAELVRAKNYCFVTAGRHLDIVPDVPKPSPTAPRRKRKPQKLLLVSHIPQSNIPAAPPITDTSRSTADPCGDRDGRQWVLGKVSRPARAPKAMYAAKLHCSTSSRAVEMGEIPLGVRLLHEELQPFAGRGRLAEGLRRTPNQVSDVAASLLNVWSCASSLGSRARGGRTLLQKGEMKHNLPTTFVMDVCPSHSRFRPISADIERSRKPSKEARFRALKAVARVRIPSGLPGGSS